MKSQIVPLVLWWFSPEQGVIVNLGQVKWEEGTYRGEMGRENPWTMDIFLAGRFRKEYIYKLKNESVFIKMISAYIPTEKSSHTQLGCVCVPVKKQKQKPIFQSISELGTLYITVGLFSINIKIHIIIIYVLYLEVEPIRTNMIQWVTFFSPPTAQQKDHLTNGADISDHTFISTIFNSSLMS